MVLISEYSEDDKAMESQILKPLTTEGHKSFYLEKGQHSGTVRVVKLDGVIFLYLWFFKTIYNFDPWKNRSGFCMLDLILVGFVFFFFFQEVFHLLTLFFIFLFFKLLLYILFQKLVSNLELLNLTLLRIYHNIWTILFIYLFL